MPGGRPIPASKMSLTDPTKSLGRFVAREPASVSEAPPSYEEIVRAQWRQILAEWVDGGDLKKIGARLQPIPVPGASIRKIMLDDPVLAANYRAAEMARGAELMDAAVRTAFAAEQAGDYGVAANTFLKAAAIMDKRYAAPSRNIVEGNPESPVRMQTDMRVTPDEAYRALLEAGK